MKLILASASPRRKELLKRITDNFEIIISDFCEKNVIFKGNLIEYAEEIAYNKALSVSNKVKEDAIVIGCDTVVFNEGKILGKPKDRADAYNKLKSLSGKSHEVISAVSIIDLYKKTTLNFHEKSYVTFSEITDEEINTYLDCDEWKDKAGGYGIQGKASLFIKGIKGDYYNIVGFPLNKVYNMLKFSI